MLAHNTLRRKPLVYGEANKDDDKTPEGQVKIQSARATQQPVLRSSKSLQRITLNNSYVSVPYQNTKRQLSSRQGQVENISYASKQNVSNVPSQNTSNSSRPSVSYTSAQGLDNSNEVQDWKKKEDDSFKVTFR